MQNPKRYTLLALGLAATVLLTGCSGAAAGGSLPDTSEEALGGAQALEKFQGLYDQAIDEGKTQVVIYGPTENVAVETAFNERFPGIELVAEQLQGADRDVRLDAEAQSGNFAGDILQDGGTPIVRAASEGRCSNLELIADVPDQYQVLNGLAQYTTASNFGMVYNTDMLSADEVPQSWEDLLDPKWKGKITVVSPSAGGISAFAFAYMLATDANAQKYGMDFLQKLHAQDLNLVSKDPLAVQAVSSGESPLAILVFKPFYNAVKDKGAPIEYSFPMKEDNMVSLSGLCVLNNAPNRAAAELYVNWRYSSEGQATLAEAGSYPVMDGIQPPDGLPPLSEVHTIPMLPDEERVEGYKPYIEQVIGLFK